MLLGSFSEKKNALFWREISYLSFSKTTMSTNSNFILSMFSREIYSKFYVVFTTYKNTKIKKKLLGRYSVKKYFLRLQLNWLLFFYFCFVLTPGHRGLPESLNRLFKIDFVWSNKHQGDLRTDYIIPWSTSL